MSYLFQTVIFQSTPPRRRRLKFDMLGLKTLSISIHASAKEATCYSITISILKYFNPRLREGGDFPVPASPARYTDFNPRLREGGDVVMLWIFNENLNFNPRLREGGDMFQNQNQNQRNDFNPRLREGGDVVDDSVATADSLDFNPRLREGGDT